MPRRSTVAGSPTQFPCRRIAGFTLIELLIIVVIVGILAGIAYPSYKDSVYKSRRSEAKAALSDLAARQEQYFQNFKEYAGAVSDLNRPDTTEGGWYVLSITIPTAAIVSSTYMGYTLEAQPTGDQTNDTKCATFRLTHTGTRSVTGTQTTGCW